MMHSHRVPVAGGVSGGTVGGVVSSGMVGGNSRTVGVSAAGYEGIGGVCFEPEGAVTTTKWVQVGHGRGGYEKMQPQYNYVGSHQGSYEREVVTTYTGTCRNVFAVLLLVVIIGAGCFYAAPFVFVKGAVELQATTAAPRQDLLTTPAVFDCQAGFWNWQNVWSPEQQKYCCATWGRACPSTSHLPFDCRVGVISDWPLHKKLWCCDRFHVGCTTTSSTTIAPYDCKAGACADWSSPKKSWCCEHEQLGCPTTTTTTTTMTFDCTAGASNWGMEWSDLKQQWCCKTASIGCPTTTTHGFNCQAGAFNWEQGWSDQKKAWCCKTSQIACDPWDCHLNLDTFATSWCTKKQAWCCQNQTLGCPTTTTTTVTTTTTTTYTTTVITTTTTTTAVTTTTPTPYDCKATADKWESSWSLEQRVWCCEKENIGCDPYDCQLDLDKWETAWGTEKQGYCCTHKKVGCVKDTTEKTTVETTTTEVKTTTTEVKTTTTEVKTTTTTTTTTTTVKVVKKETKPAQDKELDKYDCDKDLATWEESWCAKKKAWCCQHKYLGCLIISTTKPSTTAAPKSTTAAPPSFDCTLGAQSWENSWAVDKMKWCCVNQQVACDPWDCNFGLNSWESAWCDKKKAWCCQNKKLGCPTTTPPPPPPPPAALGTCRSDCLWKGSVHSCGDRMVFAAQHRFADQPNPCQAARDLVISECDFCAGCSIADSGCAAPPKPAPEPFHCSHNLDTWEKSWTTDKKTWCCKNKGIGCDPYDCTFELNSWQTTWCPKKKSWCCQNQHLGCDVTTTSPPNCNSMCDFGGSLHSCQERILFAADHRFRGQPDSCVSARQLVVAECEQCSACSVEASGCTPSTTQVPQVPFHCDHNRDRWETAWSSAKKAFCCTSVGVGCNPYDCNQDLATAETSWCAAKKAWCCQNKQLGCPKAVISQPTGCHAQCTWKGETHSCRNRIVHAAANRFANAPDACRLAQALVASECDFCGTCSVKDSGCVNPVVKPAPVAPTSAPYDCEAGFAKWERGWSDGKKLWCCQHAGRGCPTTTTTCQWDCKAGLANWQKAWSEDKKEWCCENQNVGCPKVK